jgi:hypothetical protein
VILSRIRDLRTGSILVFDEDLKQWRGLAHYLALFDVTCRGDGVSLSCEKAD